MTRRDLLGGLAAAAMTCATSAGFTVLRLSRAAKVAHPCDVCGREAATIFRVGVEYPGEQFWQGILGDRLYMRCARHPPVDVPNRIKAPDLATAEWFARRV